MGVQYYLRQCNCFNNYYTNKVCKFGKFCQNTNNYYKKKKIMNNLVQSHGDYQKMKLQLHSKVCIITKKNNHQIKCNGNSDDCNIH